MLCALWSLREFELNQTAHVQEARGSLGTKNMAANQDEQDVKMSFRVLKERLFSALIRVFQRIWSVKCKR